MEGCGGGCWAGCGGGETGGCGLMAEADFRDEDMVIV